MDRSEANKIIKAVEDALRAGGKPPGETCVSHERGAIAIAADALGIHRATVKRRLTEIRCEFDIEPDWSLRAAPENQEIDAVSSPPDHKEIIRLRDEVIRLKRILTEQHRAEIDDEAIREILGGFCRHEVSPPKWTIDESHKGGVDLEVPITIWSDFHAGEVVEPDEVHGINAFNMTIFEARIRRLVERTIDLLKNHGPGNYPGIIVNIIGDIVSGALHPELAKTDELEILPTVLRVVDILSWALEELIDAFGRVYVPCASGNHGRQTHKPEFKRYVYKNFDWLIYQLLARHFAKRKEIVFSIPPENEVHYRVFGKRYLAMHGDMLGVRGGDGLIGCIGPIMRGAIKVGKQQSVIGRDFDTLLLGHWHQSLWLPGVIVNNTLKGFDEFAKNALRAPPSTPSQSLWLEHPRWGRTMHREVLLEDPPSVNAEDWVSVFERKAS
jgi:hypothetical protein